MDPDTNDMYTILKSSTRKLCGLAEVEPMRNTLKNMSINIYFSKQLH